MRRGSKLIRTDSRVSGRVSSHHLVMRRVSGASGVTRDGAGDALDMLEHALDTLEAAADEDGDFGCRLRVRRQVEHRRRNRARTLGRRRDVAQRNARASKKSPACPTRWTAADLPLSGTSFRPQLLPAPAGDLMAESG